MTFSPAILAENLAKLEAVGGDPGRFLVAFSGGLDSTVLAHALATGAGHYSDVPIVSLHVNHGLQDDAAAWSRHCEDAAARMGIEYHCLSVRVDVDSGMGPEASARSARYEALRLHMQNDDWLLSAHHREDQAETLLLNLIRGSGPAGVAGIGSIQRFGPGWLARPLLDVDRSSLEIYAAEAKLRWVEDPSNADQRYDRNFLRHEILPRLKSRWPDTAARLQRSARHAGEASRLLQELAKIDLDMVGGRTDRLAIDALLTLSPERQRNLVRYALRDRGLAIPSAVILQRILDEVVPARADAQPLVSWSGACVRRYRNGLYLLPESLAAKIEPMPVLAQNVSLGTGLGTLQFIGGRSLGVDESFAARGFTIRPRKGGEDFRPQGQRHTRKLKKLLQEEGVVPWMRDRVPLVYSGETLVAVADLWLAHDAAASPGLEVRWHGRPALH